MLDKFIYKRIKLITLAKFTSLYQKVLHKYLDEAQNILLIDNPLIIDIDFHNFAQLKHWKILKYFEIKLTT